MLSVKKYILMLRYPNFGQILYVEYKQLCNNCILVHTVRHCLLPGAYLQFAKESIVKQVTKFRRRLYSEVKKRGRVQYSTE